MLEAGKLPFGGTPLSGITHAPSQPEVAENLLLLQVRFLRQALGLPDPTGRTRLNPLLRSTRTANGGLVSVPIIVQKYGGTSVGDDRTDPAVADA